MGVMSLRDILYLPEIVSLEYGFAISSTLHYQDEARLWVYIAGEETDHRSYIYHWDMIRLRDTHCQSQER